MDALGGKYREECEPLIHVEPTRELERQDLRRKLYEALAQLPVAQRQTFVLHAEAELSYREVAETLNISIGTVMSRLYYARQRLRVMLEPWMQTQ
jgi:RNA polymerase sigma-70 factor (ECF subfamily)